MKRLFTVEGLIRLTIILLLFLCGFLLYQLAPIWLAILHALATVAFPFLLSALIAYLLHPLVARLVAWKIPRPLSILLIYLAFFGLIGYAFFKGIPYLIEQMRTLNEQIPEMLHTYRKFVAAFYEETSDFPEAVHDRFRDFLHSVENALNHWLEKAINLFRKLFESFFVILMIPVLVFYFLNDARTIKRTVLELIPKKWRLKTFRLLKEIDRTFGGYLRGQLFVCFFLFLFTTVAFWLIGLPYPIILGIIVGITDIIPYFGPLIGAAPAVFMAITVSWKLVIYVLLVIVIVQFVESHLLSPFIVGKTLNIHPALMIFVLFAGGEIAGVLGLLLAIPVFAVLKTVFRSSFRPRKNQKKPVCSVDED